MIQDSVTGQFLDFCTATGLCPETVRKYYHDLKTLRRHLGKGLEGIRKPDCIGFFLKLETNGYAEATINHYKLTIRKFLRWRFKKLPEFIKPYLRIRNHCIIRPMTYSLTEKEQQGILDVCKDLQEKTFFGIIMETGCRVDELLQTKMQEIDFDGIGGLIVREGKRKRLRRIRIIKSEKLLRKYLRTIDRNPKDRLFDYTYWNVRAYLKRLERRSKVGKHLHMHLFRKVVATKLATHMTEFQLCLTMGWVQGSRMARHYVFLSGKDVDPVLSKVNRGSWN